MLLSVLICFYGKKISVSEFLRSARSSFLLFPIKKENRQRLYNLLSIFILKLIRIMRKSFAALLFYHSVQTRIIHFELWNIFYIMKNMLSSCATEKESPQFSPVELSSPGNLHFPILCPVHAMVPLSSLHSYTGTGSQSPLCQMLT